jgi:hypothetical protein
MVVAPKASKILLWLHTDIIFNPLNAKLNPICHLLALLGAHHILHVSRIRVNPKLNILTPWSRVLLEKLTSKLCS